MSRLVTPGCSANSAASRRSRADQGLRPSRLSSSRAAMRAIRQYGSIRRFNTLLKSSAFIGLPPHLYPLRDAGATLALPDRGSASRSRYDRTVPQERACRAFALEATAAHRAAVRWFGRNAASVQAAQRLSVARHSRSATLQPVAFDSFRDFLNQLEAAGELKRIAQPVATELEITEIADREMKKPGGGQALLIEKPTVNGQTSPFPLAINTLGSHRRMAMSVG